MFKHGYNEKCRGYLILDKMGFPLDFYSYIHLMNIESNEIYNFFHNNYSGEFSPNSITIMFKTEIDVIKAIDGLESLMIMNKLVGDENDI